MRSNILGGIAEEDIVTAEHVKVRPLREILMTGHSLINFRIRDIIKMNLDITLPRLNYFSIPRTGDRITRYTIIEALISSEPQ